MGKKSKAHKIEKCVDKGLDGCVMVVGIFVLACMPIIFLLAFYTAIMKYSSLL